jgi:hypothetical protein
MRKPVEMKKRAVVTLCIGKRYEAIAQVTHPTLRTYARRCSADFLVLNRCQGEHVFFEKLRIGSLLAEYERILYLDTDIIVRGDAPDLFAQVGEDELAMYPEGAFAPARRDGMIAYLTRLDVPYRFWNGKYYNTGVILASRQHRDIFMMPEDDLVEQFTGPFMEQDYLNLMITLRQPKVAELDHRFNRMFYIDSTVRQHRLDSYFVHYAGYQYFSSHSELVRCIRRDLKRWKGGDPRAKKVVIEIRGRLEDQVALRSVVAHLISIEYAGLNVIIRSRFPKAFQDLGHWTRVRLVGDASLTGDHAQLSLRA